MNEDKTYDIAIIGSGVVGLAAGMYAGRLELDTIILGDKYGGTLVLTDVVENYPGFKKLTGLELANKLKEHAMEYKEFVALKSAFVKEVTGNADAGFVLETNKEKFKAKTVIFTTGTKDKELPVPGHNEFKNRGVQYCALCDGALFKDKVVALVGGSDSAAKEALVLARFCKKVYMIYRGTAIHPEPVNGVRVKNTENIEIIYETNVTEIHGDTMVTHLTLDKPHKGSAEFKVDGIFIAIGHIPLTGVAETWCNLE
jgi:thioredoxin reductase (NADPH)